MILKMRATLSTEYASGYVGEIIVNPEMKDVWDFESMNIYEIQNNAIREEIEKCVSWAKGYAASLIFVVSHNGLVTAIREITGNVPRCVNINDMIAGLASG